MNIIKKEKMICPCCMEEHEVWTVSLEESNIFKGKKINYPAVFAYCENAEEYYSTEEMMDANDIAMKDAYRRSMGLLTSEEIREIRKVYGISQSDLAILLNWGEKTITRYEGHQVQDAAHDRILKKISADPEWLLALLEEKRDSFSKEIYLKYRTAVVNEFDKAQDSYNRKAIYAGYAKINGSDSVCGGTELDLDKVIDVIRYLSNSDKVKNLYVVKLMKMLWYIDALTYKQRGCSMTGLAYQAMPMGAVPMAYKSIINLNGIRYEEVDFGDSTGYRFVKSEYKEYPHLTDEDKALIDAIIAVFGSSTKEEIVDRMHRERAYTETQSKEFIRYEYAEDLSID